jgi:hypothetical protein
MSSHRKILAALQRLKSGGAQPTPEQYVAILDAVEQAVEVLYAAPRGSDPIATGLWYNHERAPALARLADALTSHNDALTQRSPGLGSHGSATSELERERQSDREVVRALQQSLRERTAS